MDLATFLRERFSNEPSNSIYRYGVRERLPDDAPAAPPPAVEPVAQRGAQDVPMDEDGKEGASSASPDRPDHHQFPSTAGNDLEVQDDEEGTSTRRRTKKGSAASTASKLSNASSVASTSTQASSLLGGGGQRSAASSSTSIASSSKAKGKKAARDSTDDGEGKRKYTCEECQKPFSTSGHLSRHRRIHRGEKKFACMFPQCEAKFNRQDNMTQHYRTHFSGKSRNRSGSTSTGKATSTAGGSASGSGAASVSSARAKDRGGSGSGSGGEMPPTSVAAAAEPFLPETLSELLPTSYSRGLLDAHQRPQGYSQPYNRSLPSSAVSRSFDPAFYAEAGVRADQQQLPSDPNAGWYYNDAGPPPSIYDGQVYPGPEPGTYHNMARQDYMPHGGAGGGPGMPRVTDSPTEMRQPLPGETMLAGTSNPYPFFGPGARRSPAMPQDNTLAPFLGLGLPAGAVGPPTSMAPAGGSYTQLDQLRQPNPMPSPYDIGHPQQPRQPDYSSFQQQQHHPQNNGLGNSGGHRTMTIGHMMNMPSADLVNSTRGMPGPAYVELMGNDQRPY